MKYTLSIFFFVTSTFCNGQIFKLITDNQDTFYKIILNDSLNLQTNYPDGRYKIFLSDSSKLPQFVFNVLGNNVNGPFLNLNKGEYTYGNYLNDSTWSFITMPNDTTFKTGTWRTCLKLYSSYENNYYRSCFTSLYSFEYDTNGYYNENWFFHNGNLARSATYKKGIGLVNETYWDFETHTISEQTINSQTKIYNHTITYKNDSISFVSVSQNGVDIFINYNYPFCDNPCVDISVYTNNWDRSDLPITTLLIDSTKTVTQYSDVKRQIFVNEHEDGSVTIEYTNKRGKRKYKRIK